MRLQSEITIEFRAENLCGFQDFGIDLSGGRKFLLAPSGHFIQG